MDKYIFLDIDGVLNKQSDWINPLTLNLECVENFAKIAKATKAKIVLVSTWKLGYDVIYEKCSKNIQELIDIFNKYKIKIYGITPTIEDFRRDKEVSKYLENKTYSNYIIIDDDLSLYGNSVMNKKIYETDYTKGLTHEDVNKIIKRLS